MNPLSEGKQIGPDGFMLAALIAIVESAHNRTVGGIG
jgi:hypothetical protein